MERPYLRRPAPSVLPPLASHAPSPLRAMAPPWYAVPLLAPAPMSFPPRWKKVTCTWNHGMVLSPLLWQQNALGRAATAATSTARPWCVTLAACRHAVGVCTPLPCDRDARGRHAPHEYAMKWQRGTSKRVDVHRAHVPHAAAAATSLASLLARLSSVRGCVQAEGRYGGVAVGGGGLGEKGVPRPPQVAAVLEDLVLTIQ
jgi:hypothetical protein